jgi:hypothetical protein
MICLYNLIPKSAKSSYPLAGKPKSFYPGSPINHPRKSPQHNDIDKSDLKTLKNRVEINPS